MNGPELLREAGALVGFGWCQGATARSVYGAPVDPCADEAVSWSLLGALQAASFGREPASLNDIRAAVEAIGELLIDPSLSHWNDAPSRTKSEVRSLLSKAEQIARPAHALNL